MNQLHGQEIENQSDGYLLWLCSTPKADPEMKLMAQEELKPRDHIQERNRTHGHKNIQ